jgi:Multiubiquitin
MADDEKHHKETVVISVDGTDVQLPGREVTGLQIKQAAGVRDDIELYGPKDQLIGDEETIEIHHGEKFTANDHPVSIRVNKKPVEVPAAHVTGLQIKQAAGLPDEFQLFGPKDEPVTDTETVHVHRNEKFTAISGQDVS